MVRYHHFLLCVFRVVVLCFFLDLVAWWHTTMPPVPLDRNSAEKSGIRAVNGPNSGIVHDDPDDARRLSSATCATRAAS